MDGMTDLKERIARFRQRYAMGSYLELDDALPLLDELEEQLHIVAEDRNANWSYGQKLEAENRRMREALSWIRQMASGRLPSGALDYHTSSELVYNIERYAEAALADKGEFE